MVGYTGANGSLGTMIGEELERLGVNHISMSFAVANRDGERVLREGECDWTILRPNLYADAILRMSLGGVEERRLVLPWQTGRVAYVARRDIAEVAARLLAQGGFVGESLPITGAKSMNLADVGEALSRASGRSWTNSPTDMRTYEEGLSERFPLDTVQAYMGLCRGLEAGRLSETSDTVERICARKPTSLEAVLEKQLADW